jgi:23S rRNA (adenine2503-C2)-methyltransferase
VRNTDLIATDGLPTTLHSELDNSVNFVIPTNVGFLESRYVRRRDEYFITYLSSQTGCNQGCRMCHLTATNQRKFVNTSHDQFIAQARLVLDHYKTKLPAKLMHYNYMARGEPLENPGLLSSSSSLFESLNLLASEYGDFAVKHIISTIMPKTMLNLELSEIFAGHILPEIYYSLYSFDLDFRKKWLPNAIAPGLALDKLLKWQQVTSKRPKIHYAFISGENDRESDIETICNEINRRDLQVDINVVRYNPYSSRYGDESSIQVIERNMSIFENLLPPSKIQLVTKVGFDVKASCGMFVGNRKK